MMKKIQIRDLKSCNFNKVKRLNTKFPKYVELSFAGMQANADECCVRILLGDNTGGGVVMLRPLSSSVSAACTVGHMCTQFQLAQNSTGPGHSGRQLLHKFGERVYTSFK